MRMTVDELLIEARGVLPHHPGRPRPSPRRRRAPCWSTFVATISAGPAGWSLGPLCCPATRWSGTAIPRHSGRHPEIDDWARPLTLICDEGFQSSLAAATLGRLGLVNATDLNGGFPAGLRPARRRRARTRPRKRP